MLSAVEARKISNVSAEKVAIKESVWTPKDERQFNRFFKRIRRSAESGYTEITCGGIRPNVRTKLESLGYKIKGCGVAEQLWTEIHWGNNF